MYRKVSIVSAPLILRISRSSSAYIREGEGAYYTVLVKKRVSDNRIIVSIALSANISYLGGGGGGGGGCGGGLYSNCFSDRSQYA